MEQIIYPPGVYSPKPKVGLDRAKTGRKKGTPNKTTALLKDAILKAGAAAGGEGGLEGYLQQQAKDNPGPFMALLGKVLPLQLSHSGSIAASSKEQRDAAVAAAARANG